MKCSVLSCTWNSKDVSPIHAVCELNMSGNLLLKPSRKRCGCYSRGEKRLRNTYLRKMQRGVFSSGFIKIPPSHGRFDPAGYYIYRGGTHGATSRAFQQNPQVRAKKRKINRSKKRLLWYRKGRGGKVKYIELTK